MEQLKAYRIFRLVKNMVHNKIYSGAFVKLQHVELENHYNLANGLLKDLDSPSMKFEAFLKCLEPIKDDLMMDPLPIGLEAV